MSENMRDKFSILPASVQKHILVQPGIGSKELFGALPRVSRALGSLCESNNYQIDVVLRSKDQAESFSLWVGKHGSRLRSLTITAEGNWMSKADSSTPSDANGYGAWSRLWYKLLAVQSAAPQLQQVYLRRRLLGKSRLQHSTTACYLSVPMSALSLLPRQTITALHLATPEPQYPADLCQHAAVASSALPYLRYFSNLQQLQITWPKQDDTVSGLSCLTTLTKLVIDASGPTPESDAISFIPSLPSLSNLSLTLGQPSTLDFLSGLSALSSLTSLYLKAERPDDDGITGLPALAHLTGLQQFTYLGPAGLIREQLPLLTGLRSLLYDTSRGCHLGVVTVDDIIPASALAPLQGLTSLSGHLDTLDEDFVSSLKEMRELRSLELCGLDPDGPLYVEAVVSGIARLTALTKLCFRWIACHHSEAVRPMLSVLTSLTGLHHLELDSCLCTSDHVAAVAVNLTCLTHLTLGLMQGDNWPYVHNLELDPAALCMLTLLTGLEELVFKDMRVAEGLVDNDYFSKLKRVVAK